MELTGSTPSSQILDRAATALLQNAQNELLQILRKFSDTFQSVGIIYLTGKLPAGNCGFHPISSFIGRRAELILRVNNYKRTLACTYGRSVSCSPENLGERVQAFVRMIRHCADASHSDKFNKLERMTRECITFISVARVVRLDVEDYTCKLNVHVDGLVDYMCTVICEAVIGRECDIEENRAEPLPYPMFEKAAQAIDWDSTDPQQLGAKVNAIWQYCYVREEPRKMAIDLIEDIRNDRTLDLPRRGSEPCSYRAVVNQILQGKIKDKRYAARIKIVEEMAKRNPNGPEAFWRSLAKQAEPNRRKKRGPSKRHDPNAPPGPCAIPQGW